MGPLRRRGLGGAPSEGINMILKGLPSVPSEDWDREGAFHRLSGVLSLVYIPICHMWSVLRALAEGG